MNALTLAQYLAANTDRKGAELNNEGLAILIALAELLDPQSLADAVAAGVAGGAAGVTIHSTSLGASDTVTIPIGAKGWSATILTGTGTINSIAGLPAGFSTSDPNKLAVAIVVSTDAASSAYVQWAI